MGDEGEGMEIARTILPMANNLRLDVVAEGVETIQQVAMLKKLHCKYGQGFYFSRPLSAEGIRALLAGGLTWQACEQAK
jgi:EAL domain-containing protein (putative c-di-GMP-specific phosphodiesterase class I)